MKLEGRAEPDEATIDAAVATMLRAAGNPILRMYMPATQQRLRDAMRGILRSHLFQPEGQDT